MNNRSRVSRAVLECNVNSCESFAAGAKQLMKWNASIRSSRNHRRQRVIIACFALLSSILCSSRVVAQGVARSPGRPPDTLQLDPFYQKHLDFQGLPIVSSGLVPDPALVEARRIIGVMLVKRPEMLVKLKQNRVRVVVMARSEVTTDIPEHGDLTPQSDWDRRARGLGATHARPAVSCAEENLLRYSEDPYRGESILTHEFAHTLHEMAIVEIDETFDTRLKAAFSNAMERGLWNDTYAASNHREYWAEGVQSWFNENADVPRANGIHNGINTHLELSRYDPTLAQLIGEWFDAPSQR